MIKVKAELLLYKGAKKRKVPIKSDYHPLFEFINKSFTSGHIGLSGTKGTFVSHEISISPYAH